MKKTMRMIAVALILLAVPLSAMAMNHQKHEHGHKHDDQAGMLMLGEQTIDGVTAMAHLNDVKAAMAKIGMKETHHFMVAFVDATGNHITEGTVAVKVVGPDGKEGDPVKLMGMEGHFGADIVLAGKGKYEFKVGTKLPDGKTRQYQFDYPSK